MIAERRNFLIFSGILGISHLKLEAKKQNIFKKSFKSAQPTIVAVQKYMFPERNKFLVHAPEVNKFLFQTITHQCYDKDVRNFVVEGAQEFRKRTSGRFATLSQKMKEKALRDYEKTPYGSAWLSRIMTLTVEGILSDPIYGVNVDEDSWKTLNAFGGFPRPKNKYLDV